MTEGGTRPNPSQQKDKMNNDTCLSCGVRQMDHAAMDHPFVNDGSEPPQLEQQFPQPPTPEAARQLAEYHFRRTGKSCKVQFTAWAFSTKNKESYWTGSIVYDEDNALPDGSEIFQTSAPTLGELAAKLEECK